jgi:RNA polymerase sigma-70 factor (ECF subfamily)
MRRGRIDDELEGLFRTEYPRLVRALAVSCGDADRAADAVQDAFVQASRHWSRISSYADPAQWLRRVALNRLANRSRDQVRHAARVRRAAAEPPVPTAPTDPVVVDLRAALSRLPEGQRLAICLHYLADLTVAEVAGLLGVADGTVKSQLSDGRKNLNLFLEVNDERR